MLGLALSSGTPGRLVLKGLGRAPVGVPREGLAERRGHGDTHSNGWMGQSWRACGITLPFLQNVTTSSQSSSTGSSGGLSSRPGSAAKVRDTAC